MHIIVQKFGGTSVDTDELRKKVASKIIQTKKDGMTPIVVVSALGRNGDPYATDTLVNLANSNHKEFNSRELDMVMSCGEIISAVVLANTIKSMGHSAIAVTGFQAGIITDEKHGDAEVIRVDTTYLYNILEKGIIPVVTGFQGVTEYGEITTLGRGGSDTTAAILGEAFKSETVEIYTDVDGVMTADPRLVTEAKVIDTIGYDEIYQMAEDGAKVVHPRAIEVAKRGNVTLKIKNTLSNAPGTIINDKNNHLKSYRYDQSQDKVITGIAHKNNIVQVNVYFEDCIERNERLMNELTNLKISIDLINFFTDKKVFTIENTNVSKLKKVLEEYQFKYNMIEKCSKITVIGQKMRGVPGVMAKIVKALSSQNIQILQTSDSHTTISCLVKEEKTKEAVNVLHKEFKLYR
ncbi:aspartate kinase [Lutibacter sp. B2]|nr:aspartate kinase [Lutibacter sp. B2]